MPILVKIGKVWRLTCFIAFTSYNTLALPCECDISRCHGLYKLLAKSMGVGDFRPPHLRDPETDIHET